MTGLPFSPYIGARISSAGAAAGTRVPNYVAGCSRRSPRSRSGLIRPAIRFQPRVRWATSAAIPSRSGSCKLDLSLSKETRIRKISENFRVQFRVDAFNIFNHPQFGQPGNTFSPAQDRERRDQRHGERIGGNHLVDRDQQHGPAVSARHQDPVLDLEPPAVWASRPNRGRPEIFGVIATRLAPEV